MSRAPEPEWRPRAGLAMWRARARMYANIRTFFAAAGVLEVETPIASTAAVSDPALASLRTACAGPGGVSMPLWLHSSPELAMKRLLAAGSGPIYQICKVFRDGERGRRHHPEFSLLEWYRPGWESAPLIDEVAALVSAALEAPSLAMEVLGYRELFLDRLGLDPWRTEPREARACAQAQGLGGVESLDLDLDGWLELLFTHCLEPDLGRGRLTFVRDYPPSQAALARIREAPEPVADRFELYLEGVELANGFRELTEAGEQRRRFEADLEKRRLLGLETLPLDERFLAALEAGLPEASGVALGLDRLLMVQTGCDHLDEVLAFPVERA